MAFRIANDHFSEVTRTFPFAMHMSAFDTQADVLIKADISALADRAI